MSQQENKQGLDRYLSPFDIFAMAIGVMVGWGAFVMPGTTFLPVAGPKGTLIALAIGTAVMLVIASNFAYLIKRRPGTGGVYSYTKEAFGRDHAFLSSWFLCLSYLTIVFLNGNALFIVVRTTMHDAVAAGFHYTLAGNTIYLTEVLISAAAFALIGILFIRARLFLQRLFGILSAILIAGVLIIGILCIPHAVSSGAVTSFGSLGLHKGYTVFTIVILAPWAFAGFDAIAFDSAHFKFPLKRVRWILFAVILTAGLLYAAMTLTGVSFVPDGYASWGDYLNDLDNLTGVAAVPTFSAAGEYMGTPGLVLITVTALAAIFTGIIGAYRAALRVLSTMAEDQILSRKFNETRTSIDFITILSILLSMLGRNILNWFVDLTSFGTIVAYGYTSAAAYKIGKTESRKGPMITGAAGTIIAIAFTLVQLIPRLTALDAMGSEAFFLLALWCLLGFIFYLRTINETTLTEFTGMSTSGVVLFALLVYTALMWLAKRLVAGGDAGTQHIIATGGVVLLFIVFAGLGAMMHIQNQVRLRHEAIEREKIRAVEGSLAKSQFLFNMSHDIRTPMNAIIGYTDLAMKENDPAVLHEYLTKIRTSGGHLLTLINDVLEMSRIESGKIELEYVPTDLNALMEDMVTLFSDQMRQKYLTFSVHTGQVAHPYV